MRITSIIFTFLVIMNLNGQVDLTPERFAFEPELSYNPDITSPESFLGYELGERFTLYANSVEYFKLLASQSNRVTIDEYGETYEGRKLYYLTITSKANHERLDDILVQNERLSSPSKITNTEASILIDEKPVFVSYSYNIHGNEASGTESVMQVAYRLAAVDNQETREMLDGGVMIFYICINPDGRDRYVYWYNGARRMVTADSPADFDHHAPWPNGRTNHYWFDLNRDWIWGVHPESRGHTSVYQEWMPQIHVDYHEQGYNNNYFTVPGTTPRNMLLPDNYEPMADTIGMANVKEFNKHKVNYFTREAFDFFYPGYGSSYPTVMGAVGMLTEQGGIGAGVAVENNDGYILTLRQRVFDHYTTSIATIKRATEKKSLFNRYFFEAMDHRKSKSDTKAYIIRNESGGYINEFLNVLHRNKIEVLKAEQPFNVSGYGYRSGKSENVKFNKGDYIIKTDQPRHLLINTIMTHQMEIEDSVMYDMSTWSAPMAYNLEAYSTNRQVSVQASKITSIQNEVTGLEKKDDVYAYIIDYNQTNAPKALALLWQKGYKVRMATKPFTNDGSTYQEGALIILKGRNLDKEAMIDDDMMSVSQEAQVVIQSSTTGRSSEGIDLASRFSEVLHPSKAALLIDQPFSTYTCGQIYFLFDQVTQFGVDRIRSSQLEQSSLPKLGSRYGYADLNDYNVLILAGGGSRLSHVFDDEGSDRLVEWVRNGGTLVLTESASSYFVKKKNSPWILELFSPERDSSSRAKTLPYADRRDFYGKKRIPGAALRGSIDTTHPLAFGMKDEVYSLKFGTNAFFPSTQFESVGLYENKPEDLMASGYAPSSVLEDLAGKAFSGVSRIGKGKVVYLLDNTQYRMFWKGPSRMMQNAVMILPSM